MLAKLLILLTVPKLLTASNIIIIWGSYDISITDVLYTADKETILNDEACWNLLEQTTDYEIAFWSDETCYLNTYQYVESVESDGGKTKKIAFRISDDLTVCPDIFQSAESEYHKISYDGTSWNIEPKVPCAGDKDYWTIRETTIVCYSFNYRPKRVSYSKALSFAEEDNKICSSPINMKALIFAYNENDKENDYLKSRVITDAKRSDSCNTIEQISTSECQYPNGFDFEDPTNPSHSLYEFVANPTISTEHRCVAMLLDLQDPTINGKFDFVKCEEKCENDYCSYYYVSIKMENS